MTESLASPLTITCVKEFYLRERLSLGEHTHKERERERERERALTIFIEGYGGGWGGTNESIIYQDLIQ